MSGNFKEAADFAAKLVKESAWSPAIYTWMQAVALVRFLLYSKHVLFYLLLRLHWMILKHQQKQKNF